VNFPGGGQMHFPGLKFIQPTRD